MEIPRFFPAHHVVHTAFCCTSSCPNDSSLTFGKNVGKEEKTYTVVAALNPEQGGQ